MDPEIKELQTISDEQIDTNMHTTSDELNVIKRFGVFDELDEERHRKRRELIKKIRNLPMNTPFDEELYQKKLTELSQKLGIPPRNGTRVFPPAPFDEELYQKKLTELSQKLGIPPRNGTRVFPPALFDGELYQKKLTELSQKLGIPPRNGTRVFPPAANIQNIILRAFNMEFEELQSGLSNMEIEEPQTISDEQIDTNMQTTSDAPSDELIDIKMLYGQGLFQLFDEELRQELTELEQKLRNPPRNGTRVLLPTANTQNTIPRAFRPLCFMKDRAKSIPEHSRWILFSLYLSFIRYQAGNMEHELNPVNHSDAREALLSLGEAFDKFSAAIMYETVIMMIYPQILLLIGPVEPVYQVFVFISLIAGLLQYVPYLVSSASGVAVTCGSFKLPLFWFTTSVALPLSLIVNYLILCGIFHGNAKTPTPIVRELDDNVEGFIDLEKGQMNE